MAEAGNKVVYVAAGLVLLGLLLAKAKAVPLKGEGAKGLRVGYRIS